MQHQIISYLKFLWNAKNEHGVHSPFVYDLITKCFYTQNFPEQNSKYATCNTLILKTIRYLNLKEIVRFNTQENLNISIDGLLISNDTLQHFSIEKVVPFCNNDSCFFIEHIHKTKEVELIWKQLCQHEAVTCSIETYNLGLLFIRKEQQKEHFIINPHKSFSSLLFERIRI
jgi:hypothetical protein